MPQLTKQFQVLLARLRLALRVPLDSDLERANYRFSVVEGALATITIQVVATFTPVFAIALGATNQQVGFIYSFPFLFNIAALIVSKRFTGRQGALMKVGQGTAYVHRAIILLFIAAPFLGTISVWWTLLLYSFASASLAVSSVFWQAISSDMFPENRRGLVFGTRAMYTGAVGLVAVMLTGKVLDAVPYPHNYTLVYSLAAVIGFVAAFYYGKLTPPSDEDGSDGPQAPPRLKVADLLRTAAGKRFTGLTLTVALFNLGFHIASPIATIYFVEYLGLSNAVIGMLTAVSVLFQVLGARVWGQIADRWGNGTVVLITTVLMAIQAAIFAVIPSVGFLMVVQAVGGFALGGYNLSTLNALFLVGDRRLRPQLIIWYNVIVGIANFSGPQFGTFLLSRYAIGWVFGVAGGVRMLGALLMTGMARRDAAATQSRRATLKRMRLGA